MIQKKDGNRQNNRYTSLRLFRLYDPQHIICNAPLRYRQAYYTALKASTKDVNSIEGYAVFFASLKRLFDLPEAFSEQSIEDCIKTLSKPDIKRQRGFFGYFKKPIYKHLYIYLLIVEVYYFINREENKNAVSFCTSIINQYVTSQHTQAWFNRYRELLDAKNIQLLKEHVQTAQDNYIRQTLHRINEHLITIINYEALPVFNISVIATMSAGKSTFVNALLGNEIFPESNTACTAKITSVYDNDFYNRITGIALKNGNITSMSNDLHNKDLREWNSNSNFDRIILEGNLDNISSRKKIVAVHDTPGTNFSGDKTHKQTTIEFLENTKIDILLCVLNAAYIGTNDEVTVLQQIHQIQKKNTAIKIIFIVNKIDVFDPQKESLPNALEEINNHLAQHGFHNAVIIPTSAKAARLFKMVLTGKYETFTENEIDNFTILFRKYAAGQLADPIGIEALQGFSPTYSAEESISIDGQEYVLRDVEHALYNTGFINIEHFIDSQMINYNGGLK